MFFSLFFLRDKIRKFLHSISYIGKFEKLLSDKLTIFKIFKLQVLPDISEI